MSDEALDAARYRWITSDDRTYREIKVIADLFDNVEDGVLTKEEIDEKIDALMRRKQ
jgi:hypothetical protein